MGLEVYFADAQELARPYHFYDFLLARPSDYY